MDQKDSKVWQIIFAVPAALCLVQLLLVLFVYPYDTPVFYNKQNNREKAREVESVIYNSSDLRDSNEDSDNDILKPAESETYSDLFTASFFNAFLIGCCLSLVQQLTGIN